MSSAAAAAAAAAATAEETVAQQAEPKSSSQDDEKKSSIHKQPLDKELPTYRQRITALFDKYAPEKVPTVDETLRVYHGKELQFIVALVKRLGPEPLMPCKPNKTPDEIGQYRLRARRMYQKFCPSRLNTVDDTLEFYKNMEELLMETLVHKYGPEPDNDEKLATVCDENTEKPSIHKQPLDKEQPTYRERIAAMYEKYAPEKLATVDETLRVYNGKELQFIVALVKRLGPEPLMPCKPNKSPDELGLYRLRAQRMYQKYCPTRLNTVDDTLEFYKNMEELLMETLVHKYGPEPDNDEKLATVCDENTEKPSIHKQPLDKEQPTYRERIAAMYEKYAPEKLATVDETLRVYNGKELQFIVALVKRLGPEPLMPCKPNKSPDELGLYRLRAQRTYQKYCPTRLNTVDDTLEFYKNMEELLMETLVHKYGPEPDIDEKLASV